MSSQLRAVPGREGRCPSDTAAAVIVDLLWCAGKQRHRPAELTAAPDMFLQLSAACEIAGSIHSAGHWFAESSTKCSTGARSPSTRAIAPSSSAFRPACVTASSRSWNARVSFRKRARDSGCERRSPDLAAAPIASSRARRSGWYAATRRWSASRPHDPSRTRWPPPARQPAGSVRVGARAWRGLRLQPEQDAHSGRVVYAAHLARQAAHARRLPTPVAGIGRPRLSEGGKTLGP